MVHKRPIHPINEETTLKATITPPFAVGSPCVRMCVGACMQVREGKVPKNEPIPRGPEAHHAAGHDHQIRSVPQALSPPVEEP